MKKLLLLLVLAISCLGYSQSKQKYIRYGKLTTAEIAAIDVTDTSVVYTAYNTDLSREEINTGSGWVARVSGVVAGSVSYPDVTNKPANIDEDSTNDVEEAPTSPEETIYWKGTKAQLYSEYGNPPTGLQDYIYVIKDSIPSTPVGGGDMLRSTYDADDDNIVDNAEQLGGVAASNYLQSEVDGSVSNELQTISKSGTNVTLSDGGGTVSIADDDNSTTNEIQSLSISGSNLTISDGNTVVLPSSGTGLTSGTFTPTLLDSGSGATYTNTSNSGNYLIVEDMVIITMHISNITRTGTATGTLRMTGLPSGNLPNGKIVLSCSAFGAGTNFYSINAVTASGQSYLEFELQTNLDGSNSTKLGSINTGGYLYVSGVYYK